MPDGPLHIIDANANSSPTSYFSVTANTGSMAEMFQFGAWRYGGSLFACVGALLPLPDVNDGDYCQIWRSVNDGATWSVVGAPGTRSLTERYYTYANNTGSQWPRVYFPWRSVYFDGDHSLYVATVLGAPTTGHTFKPRLDRFDMATSLWELIHINAAAVVPPDPWPYGGLSGDPRCHYDWGFSNVRWPDGRIVIVYNHTNTYNTTVQTYSGTVATQAPGGVVWEGGNKFEQWMVGLKVTINGVPDTYLVTWVRDDGVMMTVSPSAGVQLGVPYSITFHATDFFLNKPKPSHYCVYSPGGWGAPVLLSDNVPLSLSPYYWTTVETCVEDPATHDIHVIYSARNPASTGSDFWYRKISYPAATMTAPELALQGVLLPAFGPATWYAVLGRAAAYSGKFYVPFMGNDRWSYAAVRDAGGSWTVQQITAAAAYRFPALTNAWGPYLCVGQNFDFVTDVYRQDHGGDDLAHHFYWEAPADRLWAFWIYRVVPNYYGIVAVGNDGTGWGAPIVVHDGQAFPTDPTAGGEFLNHLSVVARNAGPPPPPPAPVLTINKVLVPADDAGKFNLRLDGSVKAADVGNGGTTGPITTTAGAHVVSETAGTGTNLADYTAVISGDADAGGNVTLANGDNKTVTITNTRKAMPQITITKILVPADDPGRFDLKLDGALQLADAQNGSTTGPIPTTAGAHTVSETAGTGTDLADYDTVIGGDAAADGSITVAAGESKTATITNTRKPAGPAGCIYLDLWVWRQLWQFESLTQIVQFPAGYARTIRFALALELAKEFGVDTAALEGPAAEALREIERLNASVALATENPPGEPGVAQP